MEPDLAIRLTPDEADRQSAPEFSARRLVANAAIEARTQDIKLGLAHRTLEAEQEPVVKIRWVIQAVRVADQAVGQPAQVDKPVPVGIVAREPRDLEPQNDTDVAEGDLSGQTRKARSCHRAGP